jgi:hypothetical protein
LTQAESGELILSGLRGLNRIEPIPLAQSN